MQIDETMSQEQVIQKGRFFLFFLILITIDQVSKYLIRSKGGFYICNKGIAWGIKIPEVSFWVFWLILIFLLFLFLYKKGGHNNFFPFLLILSGAISNIIDRLALGCVIDFIDLGFWPIFNLADVFLVLGTIFLLVKYLKL
jgi:signal peptidase II